MPGVAQPNLGLVQGYAALEDNWGDPMNANLRRLDALAQGAVVSRILTGPPASPTDGDTYIVGPSPGGLWAGHAGEIARWTVTLTPDAWEFIPAREGWRVWVSSEDRYVFFLDSVWRSDAVLLSRNEGGNGTFITQDAGRKVRCTAGSAVTMTVATNAAQRMDLGAVLLLRQAGAGAVTLTPSGGVTLNIPTGFVASTARQGSEISLHKVGTDEWDVTGDLGV